MINTALSRVKYISLLILFSLSAVSQNDTCALHDIEDRLDSLSFSLIDRSDTTSYDDGVVLEILDMLATAASCDSFFHFPFDAVRAMTILEDSLSGIKLFTGMVNASDIDDTKYYGGLYVRDHNLWIPFNALNYLDLDGFKKDRNTTEDWYGAVYYNLHPFKIEDQWHWIVFGYKPIDRFTGAKIADVLSFDNGRIIFGKAIFRDSINDINRNRILLTYAAEAPISLNYDSEEDKIIYDHLIPMKSLYQEDLVTMVPDGSYSAYAWDGEYWQFINMLEVITTENAPREQPILDKRKNKDIFGRSTKNSNGN